MKVKKSVVVKVVVGIDELKLAIPSVRVYMTYEYRT